MLRRCLRNGMYREQAPLDVHRIWGRVKYSPESGLNLQERKAGGSRKVLEAELGSSPNPPWAELWDLCIPLGSVPSFPKLLRHFCALLVSKPCLSPAWP